MRDEPLGGVVSGTYTTVQNEREQLLMLVQRGRGKCRTKDSTMISITTLLARLFIQDCPVVQKSTTRDAVQSTSSVPPVCYGGSA